MIPIPANVKLIVGAILAAVIAALQFLLKTPSGSAWTWVAPVLGALVYIDGLLTTPASAQKTIDQHAATIAKLGGAAALVIAFGLTGCGFVQKLPPNTPTDVQNATACVVDKIEHAQPVDPCIVLYGPVLVSDALQALFDSAEFRSEHPELQPTLKAELHKAKAAADKAVSP